MYSSTVTLSLNGVLSCKEFVQTVLLFAVIFFSARLSFRILKAQSNEDKRRTQLVDLFPGPAKYPILGNLPALVRVALNPKKEVFNWLEQMKKDHGPIIRYWKFSQPQIVITCSETVSELFRNDQLPGKSSEVYENGRQIGGYGLISLPAKQHAQRRKMWLPNFSRKHIDHSMKFFRQEAIKLVGKLEEFAGDDIKKAKEFDLVERSIECTFRAICNSAFGQEYMIELPESVGKDHMHALHTISVNLTNRIFRPWLYNDFFYYYCVPEGRRTKRSIEKGNSVARRAIETRKKQRADMNWKSSVSANNNFKSESNQSSSFLDHLLDLTDGGYLKEEEVLQELNVFIAAGYDTSGITICYILYLLSLNPEHQEKVVQELYDVLNITSSIINYEVTTADTKNMKYMELCIKESMRLYPVSPISPRRTAFDVTLPDKRVIPSGVDVFLIIRDVHRDPNYFPEPDVFRPDRHTERNLAFMPFALGVRSCIGQVYAMFEMKVILSYLLLTYKWETMEEPNFQPIFQTLLAPENGMRFKVTKRIFHEGEE